MFDSWLRTSRADADDAVFVMSVGGGDLARNVSPNLVRALEEARRRHVRILGVVGRDGGYTKQVGDVVVVVPTSIPPSHAARAGVQAVIWHCLVSDPALASRPAKWEGLDVRAEGRARAVFLDRDGVLVDRSYDGRPYAPCGSMTSSCCRCGPRDHALRRAGFLLIVVTNQPDVGAGRQRQRQWSA